LGIAFYGRTFELESPACFSPGCNFKGPGAEGPCTTTAGILSYREVKDLITTTGAEPIHDETAGVNYMVYGGNNWISYDDRRTFQQKVDFANKRGISGLLIWAIDLDTEDLDALKAITGRNELWKPPAASKPYDHFNINDCRVTECGGSCRSGEKTMVHTNLGPGGGCPHGHKSSKQRAFCCPEWGSPDPTTCKWHGKGGQCYGQCDDNEILMLDDDFGGATHCDSGLRKTWCCPSTQGNTAVKACEVRKKGKCGKDKPQRLTTFGDKHNKDLCCPEKPQFKNCAWHGASTTCGGNRCPAGQLQLIRNDCQYIDMAPSSVLCSSLLGGDGWCCAVYRQKAFCCDPPIGGGFLPVTLENIFPSAIVPTIKDSSFAEAFDGDNANGHESPNFLSAHNPNEESFAWFVLASQDPNDLVTFVSRDGSSLKIFDCPDVHADDFFAQTARAVCLVENLEHCEDITKGGVEGTIVRLVNCSI
jgi:chitinase